MYRQVMFAMMVLSASTTWAQDFNETIRLFQSPRWRLEQEAQDRPMQRSVWDGRGSWIAMRMFLRGGGAAELDLTPEQDAKFTFLRKDDEMGADWFRNKYETQDPEFLEAMQVARNTRPKDDPFLENATEEQRQDYIAASGAITEMWLNDMQRDIEETLSPEQLQKVRALELQLLSEVGLPSPAMFEPLGLSDEQKKQMEEIKKEMEPEFDKLLDESMTLRQERFKLMGAFLAEEYKDKKPASNDEIFQAMVKVELTDELKQKYRENMERGRKFTTLLKSRLMNVLTDEQLDKMQQLLDNTPDFVKQMLAQMKAQREANEKAGNWTPGPDSWRPGDGAPEEFKRQRQADRKANKAFPTTEN